MRPPRLGVPPHQHRILRIQKHHARRQQLLYALQNLRQPVERRPFAHIHHDGCVLNLRSTCAPAWQSRAAIPAADYPPREIPDPQMPSAPKLCPRRKCRSQSPVLFRFGCTLLAAVELPRRWLDRVMGSCYTATRCSIVRFYRSVNAAVRPLCAARYSCLSGIDSAAPGKYPCPSSQPSSCRMRRCS